MHRGRQQRQKKDGTEITPARPTFDPRKPREQRKARERALRYYKGIDPRTNLPIIDEANVRMLANKLKALYRVKELGTFTSFFHSCGIDAKDPKFINRLTKFLNFANTPNTPDKPVFNVQFFDEQTYAAVVERLFELRLWYPEKFIHQPPGSDDSDEPTETQRDPRDPHQLQHFLFPDPSFHAVSYFVGMNRNTDGTVGQHDTDHLRAYFTGDYNVYRHSTIDLGNVLIGNLSVAWDPDTRAIVTDETYLASNIGRSFLLDGYLFSYERRYRLLSRHRNSRNPQVMYIDKIERDDSSTVMRMSGVLLDIEESGTLYVTRVCIMRVKTSADKEEVRSAPLSDAPKYARVQLTLQPQIIANHIYRF